MRRLLAVIVTLVIVKVAYEVWYADNGCRMDCHTS